MTLACDESASAAPGLATATALPRRAARIQLGPPEYMNLDAMRFAKDRDTGRYFRMHERSAFLLDRLDGATTHEALAPDYERAFGSPFGPVQFESAMAEFKRHRLLEEPPAPGAPPAPRAAPVMAPDHTLDFRLVSFNPDAAIAWMAAASRRCFSTPAGLLWVLVLVATEIAIAFRLPALVSEAALNVGPAWWQRSLLLAAIYAASAVVHEGAHALALKRFGGEVREIGVAMRYFVLTPYTRLDDMLLLRLRRQRFVVLLAGPLASLSLLPFALAGWMASASAPATLLHVLCRDTLVWYHLVCLLQFVPFLQTDGYQMLSQSLRMPELRKDAASYLFRRVAALLLRRPAPRLAPGCPPYVGRVCLAYAGLSCLAVGGAVGFFLYWNSAWLLRHVAGPAGYLAVAMLLAVLGWRLLAQFMPWARSQLARLDPPAAGPLRPRPPSAP